MSVESDLLVGLAQFLNTAGVVSYKPSGGYLTTDTALVFGELPTSPNRTVGLYVYGSSDAIKENLSSYRVQVWCRGNPNNSLDAGNLADSIFQALQGLESATLNGLYVTQVYRLSLVPMGMDANKRYERSDNYLVQVNTPVTAGRPE